MTDFTPWIRPTLLGPFLTTWGFTTLGHLTIGALAATLGWADDWSLAMLLGSFFAGLIVASLIAADVVLLGLKLRQLPQGGSAWTSALLAPVLVWLAWAFFGLGDGDSIVEAVLRIAAPIVIGPLSLRLMFGRAP